MLSIGIKLQEDKSVLVWQNEMDIWERAYVRGGCSDILGFKGQGEKLKVSTKFGQ